MDVASENNFMESCEAVDSQTTTLLNKPDDSCSSYLLEKSYGESCLCHSEEFDPDGLIPNNRNDHLDMTFGSTLTQVTKIKSDSTEDRSSVDETWNEHSSSADSSLPEESLGWSSFDENNSKFRENVEKATDEICESFFTKLRAESLESQTIPDKSNESNCCAQHIGCLSPIWEPSSQYCDFLEKLIKKHMMDRGDDQLPLYETLCANFPFKIQPRQIFFGPVASGCKCSQSLCIQDICSHESSELSLSIENEPQYDGFLNFVSSDGVHGRRLVIKSCFHHCYCTIQFSPVCKYYEKMTNFTATIIVRDKNENIMIIPVDCVFGEANVQFRSSTCEKIIDFHCSDEMTRREVYLKNNGLFPLTISFAISDNQYFNVFPAFMYLYPGKTESFSVSIHSCSFDDARTELQCSLMMRIEPLGDIKRITLLARKMTCPLPKSTMNLTSKVASLCWLGSTFGEVSEKKLRINNDEIHEIYLILSISGSHTSDFKLNSKEMIVKPGESATVIVSFLGMSFKPRFAEVKARIFGSNLTHTFPLKAYAGKSCLSISSLGKENKVDHTNWKFRFANSGTQHAFVKILSSDKLSLKSNLIWLKPEQSTNVSVAVNKKYEFSNKSWNIRIYYGDVLGLAIYQQAAQSFTPSNHDDLVKLKHNLKFLLLRDIVIPQEYIPAIGDFKASFQDALQFLQSISVSAILLPGRDSKEAEILCSATNQNMNPKFLACEKIEFPSVAIGEKACVKYVLENPTNQFCKYSRKREFVYQHMTVASY